MRLKKKDALQELALATVLLLEFSQNVDREDEDSVMIFDHTRERTEEALRDAAPFTGVANMEDVKIILQAQLDNFTIDCAGDIVRGDTIRFAESVFDNRQRPPRYIGRRTVTADVTGVNHTEEKPFITLEIIGTLGTWPLKAGTETKRYLKSIHRSTAKRLPWEDETRRHKIKVKDQPALLPVLGVQMIGRYQTLRTDEKR